MKSDAELKKDILDEIRWDAQLTHVAPRIGVAVRNAVVTLSGIVDYYTQKVAAEKAAKRVKDVIVVVMEVEVQGSGMEITDGKIADAVRHALAWHSAVNDDQINIKVEHGIIYLEGSVEWEYERRAAERAVENLRGVKGVVNQVRIKMKNVGPDEVKKMISAAFVRHAAIDSDTIKVESGDGLVTLTGKVRTWTERKDAEDVVWSMPGVTHVDNQIEIGHEAYSGE